MSSWYSEGTVAVTNGNVRVTGTGTSFVGAVLPGHGFVGPDGRTYEVREVLSATTLDLTSGYMGSSQSGGSYSIFPTYAQLFSFNTRLNALLTEYQQIADGPGAGLFANGSAAAPSLSFASDRDTGVFRNGVNQIGAATGGVRRWLLSNTDFKVDVPITGTAVQSSPIDATAGRVLTTGAGGIAGSVIEFSGNIDNPDEMPTGFYRVTGAATGTKPAGLSAFNMTQIRRGTGAPHANTTQIITIDTQSSSGVMWVRGVTLTGWSTWDRVLTLSTLVSPVSEVGGRPTGGAFNYFANASGQTYRRADGLQICTNNNAPITTVPATFAGTITKIDGDKFWIGRWF